jgi:hypothetical protein
MHPVIETLGFGGFAIYLFGWLGLIWQEWYIQNLVDVDHVCVFDASTGQFPVPKAVYPMARIVAGWQSVEL